MAFGIDERTNPWWNPAAPEFVAAANAVSLIMPFAEPFVARTARLASKSLGGPLGDTAEAFAAQELAHQHEHRRFNAAVRAVSPGVRHVERALRWVFARLGRRSLASNLALTAALECIAYSLARWTSAHLPLFQGGADPVVSRMYVWHLAEEVEHKSVGFDLWWALDGRPSRYARNAVLALCLFVAAVVAGTFAQLWSARRLWNPLAWARLVMWSLSAGMEILPTLAVSCFTSHHPTKLVDPSWYALWLRDFDTSSATATATSVPRST